MKSIIFSLLPLAVSSAVLLPRDEPAEKSPFGPLGGLLKGLPKEQVAAVLEKALPVAKLHSVKTLTPQVRSTAKRTIASYGPYVLAGKDQPKPKAMTNSLDPKGQASVDILASGICKNCTILAGRTTLTFADGSEAGPAQGVYIHHVISFDINKPANLPVSKCGVGQTSTRVSLGSEFLAQGDDSGVGGNILFTSQDGKYNSGFAVGNDKFLSQVDLVNYNEGTKEVFVNYDIEYVDGHSGVDAAATLMSVTGCKNSGGHAHSEGTAPPPASAINLDKNGVAVTQSPDFTILKDGKIVSAMGHMHDGGSKMILYINGKKVCDSNAIYGKGGDNNEETISVMSPCEKNIPFKKGDVLKMDSVYDLKTHPLRAGGEHNSMGMADVMGMFYLTFAVDDVVSS